MLEVFPWYFMTIFKTHSTMVSLKREGFGFKSQPGWGFSLWSLHVFSMSLRVSFEHSVLKQATCSACWQHSNHVSNKREDGWWEGINCHAVSSKILPDSAATVCILNESRTLAVHCSHYKHYTWFRARVYKKQKKMMILSIDCECACLMLERHSGAAWLFKEESRALCK